MLSYLKWSCLVHTLTFLRKRISAARDFLSTLLVILHASLPYSKAGVAKME
jgi:hypothetical protein